MIYMLLLYTRSPCHQCSTTLSAPLTAACTVWYVPFDCGRASDPGPDRCCSSGQPPGAIGERMLQYTRRYTAQYTRRYMPTAFWVLANANDSAILSREGAPRVKEQRSRKGEFGCGRKCGCGADGSLATLVNHATTRTRASGACGARLGQSETHAYPVLTLCRPSSIENAMTCLVQTWVHSGPPSLKPQ